MGTSRFSVEATFKAIDRISGPLGAMEKKTSKFVDSVSKGMGKLSGFNSSIDAGFRRAAAGAAVLGAAGAAAMVHVGRAGIDFEQQMADLGAAYLKTRKEIAPLEQEALRLGASSKYSAIEVGAAQEELAKAGYKQQEVLAGMPGFVYAAAAANEDLALTSGNVSKMMKAMGVDISKSTQVADKAALVANATSSSIDSLRESVIGAAGPASILGIKLDDLLVMSGLLQDVGMDASSAGTSLKSMLIEMSTPTKATERMLKKLNVSFKDTAGNMKQPAAVLDELVRASDKAGGNMDKLAFFSKLAGSYGQQAAIKLSDLFKPDASGISKYQELAASLANSAGTAKKVADLKMDTLGGDIDVFTESVKGLEIRLFSLNNGPLRDVSKRVNAWVDANGELMVQKTQKYIVWTIDHLPEIVKWLERIGTGVLVFYAYSTAVKAVQVAIEGYETAVILAKGTTKAFKGTVWATGKTLDGTTKALGFAGEALGVFNTEAAAGKAGMAGLREGLNASMLGKQINGVTSLLGKAGLLGAAGLVGYEFGTWLNDTLELDKHINDLIDSMKGVKPALANMGGHASQPGLDPKGDQYLADGTIKRADGSIKRYGAKAAARWAGPSLDVAAPLAATDALAVGRSAFAGKAVAPQFAPHFAPQVVGPQERAAVSASEHTEVEKTEIVIKDETGRAEFKKKPAGKRTRITLKPTGAF